MTITPFAFTPPNGLRDASYAPTDPPNEAALRQAIQGIPDQLKDYINNVLLPTLASTTASSSGSREIGSETLPGIVGNTVYAQLLALLNYINSISIGNVPINSITNDKLGTDVKVGSLAALNTTDKASVVNAINETNDASNMLTKIKTVDGKNSGLYADFSDKLGYSDRRGTNPTPQDFVNDNSTGETLSLFNDTDIGFSSFSHAVAVKTTIPYSDTSAGVSQEGTSAYAVKKRRWALSSTTWSAWISTVDDNPTVTTITTGFASGWSGSVTAIKNHNNLVEFNIDVLVKSTVISASEPNIFTLPAGFRPNSQINIFVGLLDADGLGIPNASAILTIGVTGIVGIVFLSGTNARILAYAQSTYYVA